MFSGTKSYLYVKILTRFIRKHVNQTRSFVLFACYFNSLKFLEKITKNSYYRPIIILFQIRIFTYICAIYSTFVLKLELTPLLGCVILTSSSSRGDVPLFFFLYLSICWVGSIFSLPFLLIGTFLVNLFSNGRVFFLDLPCWCAPHSLFLTGILVSLGLQLGEVVLFTVDTPPLSTTWVFLRDWRSWFCKGLVALS